VVTMEFITKFPRTIKHRDSVIVVVDKLTEVSHFIPVNSTYKVTNIVEICMHRVDKLHGVPRTIVSKRDSKFTSIFWKGLFKGFVTNLIFIKTYHPK
jgi:hypothetical protein